MICWDLYTQLPLVFVSRVAGEKKKITCVHDCGLKWISVTQISLFTTGLSRKASQDMLNLEVDGRRHQKTECLSTRNRLVHFESRAGLQVFLIKWTRAYRSRNVRGGERSINSAFWQDYLQHCCSCRTASICSYVFLLFKHSFMSDLSFCWISHFQHSFVEAAVLTYGILGMAQYVSTFNCIETFRA